MCVVGARSRSQLGECASGEARAGVGERDVYIDHASGAKASRPQLDVVLRMLREGDTLKITCLDRLGLSACT
jgi:DNA invertase Pin-like site-specific DNA recombinase